MYNTMPVSDIMILTRTIMRSVRSLLPAAFSGFGFLLSSVYSMD